MNFIQTANKQVDKFGAGKHGFSAGNPSGGVLATLLSPDFFDDVQQELINVIEAGALTPIAATRNQLLQALPAALAGRPEMARSLNANGYQKLPGGLILQWGGTSTSGGSAAVSFPITFPTACFLVVPASFSQSANILAVASAATTSGFTAGTFTANTGGGISANFSYIALGK